MSVHVRCKNPTENCVSDVLSIFCAQAGQNLHRMKPCQGAQEGEYTRCGGLALSKGTLCTLFDSKAGVKGVKTANSTDNSNSSDNSDYNGNARQRRTAPQEHN